MTDSLSNQVFTITHQPYGEQHPYIPLNCERSPRDPASGDSVTLHVETEPDALVQQVACHWLLEGSSEEQVLPAQKISSDSNNDVWEMALPTFKGGESIQYYFQATNASHTIESDRFSFYVNRWISVKKMVSSEGKGDTFTVIFSTEDENVFIQCELKGKGKESVAIQLNQVGKNPSWMNNVPERIGWQYGSVHFTIVSDPIELIINRTSDDMVLQTASQLKILVDAEGKVLKFQWNFESPSDEAFYGFGERFNALDQRGTQLDNRVYGQYTSQGKRTYTPIPFFVSSRGYGMWLKTDRQAVFDLAAEKADQWTVIGEADGEEHGLDLQFFLQDLPKAIVQSFVKETGMPKLPPDWVFGLWMSSNDWNSQAEVLRQLQLTQEHDIPATVLVIEAWSDEINFYIWNQAQYRLKPSSETMSLQDFIFPEDGLWPDPKAMIDTLHNAGVRLVLWQNPAIKQAREDEHLEDTLNQQDQQYLIEKGYVVKKADGSPHRVEGHMPWFGDSLVFDFTNPEAADWWFSKRDYLVKEMGVDGFKTDGGEHIWDLETKFHNGMSGHQGINRYPMDYEEAYRLFMEKHRGDDFVLFSRAGYTGAQVNPCHWAGDENSTFEAFRASINAMLNIGISGVPFFGWDIAGFAGPLPSSELYLRATAFSVFCPIMQYHSDVNLRRTPSRDRTPWNMQDQSGDEDVIPIFRWFTNVRMNLLPYILGEARKSSQSGLPMTRALPLEYPADATCRLYPYEFLFGDALLVAPVVEESAETWQVYLPEGKWQDFWNGKQYQGPQTITMDVPSNVIPVFQKAGSVVSLNTDETSVLGSSVGNAVDTINHLVLRIFPEGVFSDQIMIPGENGMKQIHVSNVGDDLKITLPGISAAGCLEVVIENVQEVSWNGELMSDWTWNDESAVLCIPFQSIASDSIIFIK